MRSGALLSVRRSKHRWLHLLAKYESGDELIPAPGRRRRGAQEELNASVISSLCLLLILSLLFGHFSISGRHAVQLCWETSAEPLDR